MCVSTFHFSEITDISRGRLILTDLVERNSVPIFSKIEVALQCTKILLRKVTQNKNFCNFFKSELFP